MTTISFQVSDPQNALKLYAMLRAFGVENLTKKEDEMEISKQELAAIEVGIEQSKKGIVTPSHSVLKKARELCIK